jgi:hypothetical protein
VPADWPGAVRHEGGASLVWALVWNVEPVVRARGRPVALSGPAVVRGRETPERLICEGLSTDAGDRGGQPRGSDDAR